MNADDRRIAATEIIDGLYEQERERVLTAGTAMTRRPFYVHFPQDTELVSDADAREILEVVRAEFPDWRIIGTRTPADAFAQSARAAANKRRLAYEQQHGGTTKP